MEKLEHAAPPNTLQIPCCSLPVHFALAEAYSEHYKVVKLEKHAWAKAQV